MERVQKGNVMKETSVGSEGSHVNTVVNSSNHVSKDSFKDRGMINMVVHSIISSSLSFLLGI